MLEEWEESEWMVRAWALGEHNWRNLGWVPLDSRALELLAACQKVELLKWMNFQNRRT